MIPSYSRSLPAHALRVNTQYARLPARRRHAIRISCIDLLYCGSALITLGAIVASFAIAR